MQVDLTLLIYTYYPPLVIEVTMRNDMDQFKYAVRK